MKSSLSRGISKDGEEACRMGRKFHKVSVGRETFEIDTRYGLIQ